jgi:hypothetical protein
MCGGSLSGTTPLSETAAAQHRARKAPAAQAVEQGVNVSAYAQHCAESLARGSSPAHVQQDLVERGLPPGVAAQLVASATRRPAPADDDAGELITMGVGLLVLGAVITGITYSAASGGGTYVITTGLFVVGVIKILQGIAHGARG